MFDCQNLSTDKTCKEGGCAEKGNVCCVYCNEFTKCVSTKKACLVSREYFKEPSGLYQAAIKTFGKDSRLDIAQEEVAELVQAISKYRRKPNQESIDKLLEEMADVEIMATQLKLIFEISEEDFTTVKRAKEDKLRKTIQEAKQI